MMLACLPFASFAQNETDALRYSYFSMLGSARSAGAGGAFGSLGGDFSALHTNPAGMAVYRRSDAGLTVSFGKNDGHANYNGNTTLASQDFTQLSNIGMVAAYPTSTGVERFNMGISYTTLANFNERYTINGDALNTSLTDVFALQANGVAGADLVDAFPFGAGMAWETWLINPIEDTDNQYETALPSGYVNQEKRISRVGRMGETAMALAANISNKWYVGASMGFVTVDFEEQSTYTETTPNPGDFDVTEWSMTNTLATTGGGVNFKAGVIFRPVEYIRLGAAIHTPTWHSLKDEYRTSMDSDFKDGAHYTMDSPYGEYTYRLRTPMRAMVNASALLGKFGFVSADYEWVDYRGSSLKSARIGGDDYPFEAENAAIETAYRATHKVKLGIEAKPQKWLALRAGTQWQQSPFTDEAYADAPAALTYTAGAGLRLKGFYLDAALVVREQIDQYYLYDPAMVDPASIQNQRITSMISIGMRY